MNFVNVGQANRPETPIRRRRPNGWLRSSRSSKLRERTGPSSFCRSSTRKAKELGVGTDVAPYSPYRNSIPLERQPPFPGDIVIEERITAIIRWNALAMVVRANKAYGELGGHIASYASAAEIFETGFNHFFRADTGADNGDLVFFQPHPPGRLCARLSRRRLSEEQLKRYRQEVNGAGFELLSPSWLMPDFWQTRLARWASGQSRRSIRLVFSAISAIVPRQHPDATCLGRFRGWRNGRAGIDCRPFARGPRRARQSDLRHQLQSPAPDDRCVKWADHSELRACSAARVGTSSGLVGLGMGRSLRAR